MMINNALAPINELVAFLDENDQQKLTALKNRFDKYKEYLEPGILQAESGAGSDEEWKFRLEVSITGLESIYNAMETEIPKSKQQLKQLNTLQLLGQIVTLLSGSTIIATLQTNFTDRHWIKYIAPSLVLTASIITIWAKAKAEPFLPGSNSMYDTTFNLISLKNKARFILDETVVVSRFFNADSARLLIEKANAIALEAMTELEKK